jgi:hypothetical protein
MQYGIESIVITILITELIIKYFILCFPKDFLSISVKTELFVFCYGVLIFIKSILKSNGNSEITSVEKRHIPILENQYIVDISLLLKSSDSPLPLPVWSLLVHLSGTEFILYRERFPG